MPNNFLPIDDIIQNAEIPVYHVLDKLPKKAFQHAFPKSKLSTPSSTDPFRGPDRIKPCEYPSRIIHAATIAVIDNPRKVHHLPVLDTKSFTVRFGHNSIFYCFEGEQGLDTAQSFAKTLKQNNIDVTGVTPVSSELVRGVYANGSPVGASASEYTYIVEVPTHSLENYVRSFLALQSPGAKEKNESKWAKETFYGLLEHRSQMVNAAKGASKSAPGQPAETIKAVNSPATYEELLPLFQSLNNEFYSHGYVIPTRAGSQTAKTSGPSMFDWSTSKNISRNFLETFDNAFLYGPNLKVFNSFTELLVEKYKANLAQAPELLNPVELSIFFSNVFYQTKQQYQVSHADSNPDLDPEIVYQLMDDLHDYVQQAVLTETHYDNLMQRIGESASNYLTEILIPRAQFTLATLDSPYASWQLQSQLARCAVANVSADSMQDLEVFNLLLKAPTNEEVTAGYKESVQFHADRVRSQPGKENLTNAEVIELLKMKENIVRPFIEGQRYATFCIGNSQSDGFAQRFTDRMVSIYGDLAHNPSENERAFLRGAISRSLELGGTLSVACQEVGPVLFAMHSSSLTQYLRDMQAKKNTDLETAGDDNERARINQEYYRTKFAVNLLSWGDMTESWIRYTRSKQQIHNLSKEELIEYGKDMVRVLGPSGKEEIDKLKAELKKRQTFVLQDEDIEVGDPRSDFLYGALLECGERLMNLSPQERGVIGRAASLSEQVAISQ